MMVKQSYTVRFVTPAFLGNAEQQGQWRTPPFKALLRQWWRVAAAKDHGYNHERLRETEGKLFGNAWIENNFCKSEIRLRLDRWDEGRLKKSVWSGKDEKKLTHPEVTNKEGKTIPVGAELYLGYGPLNYDKIQKRTVLKANAAIQADDRAELHLAYPEDLTAVADVVQLIHWLGTLGGRSRNGWGSLLLESKELRGSDSLNQSDPLLNKLARPIRQCLDYDWPHAVGKDDRGLLVWTSKQAYGTWREAMMELARTKIEFRTNLAFAKGKGELEQRHVLAYPVTNHPVNQWEKYQVAWAPGPRNGRLANQLRFKVTKTEDDRYQGVAYHLPCGIPTELLNALSKTDRGWIVGQQLGVWQSVHVVLDRQMQRIQ
jgi:CRISPR-associated protein Cmr1